MLLAAVSSMVVGVLWYCPAGFLKQWQRSAGIKHDPGSLSNGQMAFIYRPVILASLVTAYVLAHVAFMSHHLFNNSFLQDSLTTVLVMALIIGLIGVK